MRGHYQKACKKAAFAGALSKSWQSGGRIHPLGGRPSDAHCDHSKHSEATKPGGEFSVNLLTFSFTKSQSIKFSRSHEDQYGFLWKYFSPNVYKDYFPRYWTLKRKLYQHFMWSFSTQEHKLTMSTSQIYPERFWQSEHCHWGLQHHSWGVNSFYI